jgi:hypothetical protein
VFATLELCIAKDASSTKELYDVCSGILKLSPLLIWGTLSGADLDGIFSRLATEGFAVQAVVNSAE